MSGGLALVLSGGGAPAAFFGTGVIQYLEEKGLRGEIAVLSGTSAGAINAGGLAVGMTAGELVELWGEAGRVAAGQLAERAAVAIPEPRRVRPGRGGLALAGRHDAGPAVAGRPASRRG
jgi:hypothetical protein